ncbi:putative CBL-interacting protein kinase 13 [Aegilops tauschii subsp. strangulata]|uniref:non-specific serine/threonine protein kinase n=3 Tax=Triticinae TaxID=1648030 RepID=A0A453ECH1_AEGTS|nr:putative CBL-interacting protein kinase 13 [Triticum aestivum]XP_045090620.1 putative CBL-interacting protein kinase 13 [Aegilops tauschii subsp. strangulata]
MARMASKGSSGRAMAGGAGGASGREGKKALLLGRFEVGRMLGQGNFAKVYQARNVATGEEVAIKVIEKEKVFKSGLTAHIKREIAALRRVRHPHIVQLYEVMATKLRIYFVMEYVRGGELFAKVAKGPLPEGEARRYFQQLVSAVAFCHARGVYHRDIKPENLLVDDAGDLKVSDFGLSAVAEQMRHDGLFHTFCGTPAYVAPEVLSRRGYDAAKADLWSCGVVLFVLGAGYLPFQDRNLVGMYRKIHRGDFRCPKWFSPELLRLMHRVLDTKPLRRATIDEIMDNEWFKVGFRRFSFRIEDDRSFTCFDLDDGDAYAPTSPPDTPRTADGSDYGDATDQQQKISGGMTSCGSAPSLLEGRFGQLGGSSRRRSSLNAFDLISFSPGFDLSGLFEDGGGEGSSGEGEQQQNAARFVSAAPVEQILAALERTAAAAGMAVRAREDGSVIMEGTREGANGALAVAAEIYELTPELVVVEVRRKSGGAAEYEEFYRSRLKPSLRELMTEEPAPRVGSKELTRSV